LAPTDLTAPQQPVSILDVFLPCNDLDIEQLNDHELDAMLMSSPAGRRLVARLSQHPSPAKRQPVSSITSIRTSAQFDDSFFDNFGDAEFPIEQPAKKRRLSPPMFNIATSNVVASKDEVFDLSSEPDIASKPQNQRLSAGTNVTVCDLDSVEDDLTLSNFSSPAANPRHDVAKNTSVREEKQIIEILSDDEAPIYDPIASSSRPARTAQGKLFSDRTNSILANIKGPKGRSIARSRSTSITAAMKQSKPKQIAEAERDEIDDIIDSSQPGVVCLSPGKPLGTTNKEKAPAKTRKTAAEKEAEQGAKRLAKERQAAEKQLALDKAEVNKRKTDRKKSAEEMLIFMPAVFKGKALGNQVQLHMKEVNVNVSFYDDEIDMTQDDGEVKSLGKIIKWEREVKATYDEVKEEWMPLGRTKRQPEKHILVYLTGEDFCTIAAACPHGQSANSEEHWPPSEESMKESLTTYVVLLGSQHPGCTIVLLIEGLTSFIKRIVNTKNREYQSGVRARNPVLEDPAVPSSSTQPTSSGRAPKKRKQSKPVIDLTFFDNDMCEILQLHIQLAHPALHIHHTTSVATSAKQIDSFTQHLSTRPYRQTELERNLAHASFCMASGQFRTGQGDAKETFIKMLEQVNRLTVSMAHGIVDAGYDSPAKLVKGFKKAEDRVTGGGRSLGGDTGLERQGREKAKLLLEDVKKAANKDGAWNNQRLGPQISKRLWKVFMSNDEDMRDGIA